MTARPNRHGRPRGGWVLAAVLLVVAFAWWAERAREAGDGGGRRPPEPGEVGNEAPPAPGGAAAGAAPGHPAERRGGYEVYQGCTLVVARNNDGDSFMVRLPDGRQRELRLYFVDAPESAFKRYAGGDSNHARIREQAAALGGITPEQAVAIGKRAKDFTLGLLGAGPFTVFTVWDSPFGDGRYHAFIEVGQAGRRRWLHELLVERGLARLKTKPAELPDGTPAERQRRRLRELESAARRSGEGAWGL